MTSQTFLAMAVLSVFMSATKLEIRLAEEQPATGLVEATVSHSEKKVYLHQSVVITNEDVASARVVPGNGGTGFNVAIEFSKQGSEKIAKATEGHIGKPLAIMVNGVVIAAPMLRSAIRQSAQITGDWTKEQANEIAAGLNGK